MIVRFASGI